jgi:hypothetical protein
MIGILVYMLEISNEHILMFWLMFKLLSSFMRSIVFRMKKVFGSVMYSLMTLVKKEATLYAGAILQFITGLIVIYLNTLENFYIYKLFWQGIQLNNNCPCLNNLIFKQIQNISR